MEGGEVLVPKPCTTAKLWVHFSFRLTDKGQPMNVEEAICKFCLKKVPIKSANATNLNSLQTHNAFVDVQKVIKLLLIIKGEENKYRMCIIKAHNTILEDYKKKKLGNLIISRNCFSDNRLQKFPMVTALPAAPGISCPVHRSDLSANTRN